MNDLGGITLRPFARRWLSALSSGIVMVYALFYVVFLSRSGPRDGDQFLVFHSLQYWNASMFGIAKQWTPLMCSGLSMAGEPQVPFMSLSMALSYMLGPLWGVKLASAIYLSLGWTGAFLYAGLWNDAALVCRWDSVSRPTLALATTPAGIGVAVMHR